MWTSGNLISQLGWVDPFTTLAACQGKVFCTLDNRKGFWQVRLRNREYKKGTKFQCVDLSTALWLVRAECHGEARHSNSHLWTVGVVCEGGHALLNMVVSREKKSGEPAIITWSRWGSCFLGSTHFLTPKHIDLFCVL